MTKQTSVPGKIGLAVLMVAACGGLGLMGFAFLFLLEFFYELSHLGGH